MSQKVRNRAARTQFVHDRILNDEERNNMFEWCGISDEILRKENPDALDIDDIAEKMDDKEFASFMERVIRTHRARKAKRKALAEGKSEAEAEEAARKAAGRTEREQYDAEDLADEEEYEEEKEEEEVVTH